MRHGKKIKKIGRSASHRKATLQALSMALIEHKRITTTIAKAKALRMFVEPILNQAKDPSTHSRRQVFSKLQNKDAAKTLFGEIAEAIGDRPGGYTRIIKLGQRKSDATEMAIIELVDFNDVKPEGASSRGKKTRRSRRRGGSGAGSTPGTIRATSEEAVKGSSAKPAPEGAKASTAPAPDGAPASKEPSTESNDAPKAPHDPNASDHSDKPQGGAPATAEPIPDAQAENQGRSADHR
jgi:large subunit ribosomal protein L17